MAIAVSGQNGAPVGWIHFFNSLPIQQARDPNLLGEKTAPLIVCQDCRKVVGLDALVLPSQRAKIYVACMRCAKGDRLDGATYIRLFFESSPKAPDGVLGQRQPPVVLCVTCEQRFRTWGRAKDDTEIQA